MQAIELKSGELMTIPLSLLVPSPINVRKVGGTHIDGLKASIRSQGVLQLLALASALTINAVQARAGRDNGSDAVSRALGLDMADWWSPTAASYLSHVPKSKVCEAVAEAVSAEDAAALAKLKKGEAVARAEALLAGKRWLPGVLRRASA
jgi:ParB family chromosome partitioning protein